MTRFFRPFPERTRVARSAPLEGTPTTYSTTFPSAENPISEGGKWLGGATDGTVYSDVRTSVGKAYASHFITPGVNDYTDDIAVLKDTVADPGPDQYAEVTIFRDAAYTPPSSHEIQIHLRASCNPAGPLYLPTYEILLPWGGTFGQIVYQPGNLGGFSVLSPTGAGYSALSTGDVVRAKIVGNVITVYVNGAEAMTVSHSSITDGQPGMGFYVTAGSGADPEKFCISSWSCGPAT